ncbi:hypothetical protein F4778DRAFT_545186 [Xylariomycetidae sp. FL2044]|nr:hypothetical protein F4778DRAFT_545186 [Xylariomycetidae sp. FL2044]
MRRPPLEFSVTRGQPNSIQLIPIQLSGGRQKLESAYIRNAYGSIRRLLSPCHSSTPRERSLPRMIGPSGIEISAAMNPQKAGNVCVNCKARKKRCDKTLPKCRYCAEHQIPCTYQSLPERRVSTVGPRQVETEEVGRRDPVTSSPWRSLDDFSERVLSGVLTNPHTAEEALCRQISRLLEATGLYLDEISVRYFETIHNYNPIISRPRFHSHLISFGARSRADFGLLLLCMGLLTHYSRTDRPSEPPLKSVDDTSLYLATKSLVAQAQTLYTPPTIHLIQASILLSVYEYAQDRPEVAFVSIGACARMAHAARLKSPSASKITSAPAVGGSAPTVGGSEADWKSDEEQISTWWGIMIYERIFLCDQNVIDQPLGSAILAHSRLPLESYIVERDNRAAAPSSIMTVGDILNSEVFIGGFGMAAQVAWLCDGVIRGLSISVRDQRLTYLRDCDMKLQSCLAIALQHRVPEAHGSFCVAIVLAIRSLFLLHLHIIDEEDQAQVPASADKSRAALDTLAKMAADISMFHENTPCGRLHSSPPNGVYLFGLALNHLISKEGVAPEAQSKLISSLRRLENHRG